MRMTLSYILPATRDFESSIDATSSISRGQEMIVPETWLTKDDENDELPTACSRQREWAAERESSWNPVDCLWRIRACSMGPVSSGRKRR
jgi:hypothetical protein